MTDQPLTTSDQIRAERIGYEVKMIRDMGYSCDLQQSPEGKTYYLTVELTRDTMEGPQPVRAYIKLDAEFPASSPMLVVTILIPDSTSANELNELPIEVESKARMIWSSQRMLYEIIQDVQNSILVQSLRQRTSTIPPFSISMLQPRLDSGMPRPFQRHSAIKVIAILVISAAVLLLVGSLALYYGILYYDYSPHMRLVGVAVGAPTVLILVGAGVLVFVAIVAVVILLLQKGSSRQHTDLGQMPSTPQRGHRRRAYVPQAKAPAILPPSVGSTNLHPRSTRWDSGMTGMVPPDVARQPTYTPAAASGPNQVSTDHRLIQEAIKLRRNGYNTVTLARRPDIEEYCLLVRIARSDGKNVSIHLICGRDYPSSPPGLVATIEIETGNFNSHGEIEMAEQRLALELPVLRTWGPASSLLAVLNDVLSTLPLAGPDRSPPTTESIFSRYTDIIA